MKLFNKYIKISVIASIAFMQTSNAFASIFFLDNDNYIQICTSNGIKLISENRFNNSKKSFVKTKTMNCCLDIHSNFVINSYNFIKPNYLIAFQNNNHVNLSKSSDFNNLNSIRAPPRLI